MRVAFALGSNTGDRMAHLQAGLDVLAEAGPVLVVSPVVETDPVGGPRQPDFLNAVVVAELPTGTDPLELAHAAERARGRTREVRWGPRSLDVDVLTVEVDGGPVLSEHPRLTLPHPRAHERAFVLVPWLAADPDAVVPGRGRAADLLTALPVTDRAGVRARADLRLRVP